MNSYKITRVYDIILSISILIFFSPILISIFIICFFESQNPIFVQKRVGQDQKPFNLIKFRTMKVNTPSLASHLVKKESVTKIKGKWSSGKLRKR